MFEITIRGLGGLLSAHLFAIKALPALSSSSNFAYNNELLHLAEDLGRRLLPALTLSPTGIPYPRINLRHGLPHGVKNPRYYNRVLTHAPYVPDSGEPEHSSEKYWRHAKTVKREKPDEETTETCTAGAGSLVLEFTTLSRLTGDLVFEIAAKRAFDAIWSRRSAIGLVGAGVDAESGQWTGANSGIGAGVDSFFEYAFKSYVLLAGNEDEGYFLNVWEKSRTALERHVLVREPALWWNNVHINTGAGIQGGAWIDSLGGFFAGTLSGAGGSSPEDDALDLAVQGNLVYSALWNKYNALPERFNTRLSTIEGGLTWYPGRPEFIESTYLIYRATKDPFWLHVGEMVMRDLKRRCWGPCGWAGLQDVRTGQRQDRMESFWLSETWKYLFLLFDEDNPLHKLDAPWVFTTEGHPIIIPSLRGTHRISTTHAGKPNPPPPPRTCLKPPTPSGFFSNTAGRGDLFHAAFFTKLHLSTTPDSTVSADSPNDLFLSPSNSTFYPYTLPMHLVPPNATCDPLPTRDAFELIFPDGFVAPNAALTLLSRFTPRVQRVADGIRILSLDALRLSLLTSADDASMRINKVSGVTLGREEVVYVDRNVIEGIKDVNFEVVPDTNVLDLVLTAYGGGGAGTGVMQDFLTRLGLGEVGFADLLGLYPTDLPAAAVPHADVITVSAVMARGDGAVKVPDLRASLVYYADSTACAGVLPRGAGLAEVVVIRRGECSFGEKIANVPDEPGVRLVVVEDYEGVEEAVAPVVDGVQMNSWGKRRRNRVGLVMVESGVRWEEVRSVGVRRRIGVWVRGREVRGVEVT